MSMRIRWRNLELPTRVECDPESLTSTFGRFYAEPFERGYGTTIGNALRRVLLTSLEGAAVTHVKIEGVEHEYSTITGIYEEVPELLLNLKGLVVQMTGDEPKRLFIRKNKKGVVTGADVETDATVSIFNKNHHIATLVEDVPFNVELTVTTGRGYVTAEENTPKDQEIGIIPIDSIFTPVTRVRYKTEDTRVSKKTNYDKLTLEIWTNGSVSPEMALVEASKILRKHLNPFIQYFELGAQVQQDEVREDGDVPDEKGTEEVARKLGMDVSVLDLSVRAQNCVDAEGITSLRQLVSFTESDLLKLRNFGKTSLKEIKKKLAELDLALGMDLSKVSLEEESHAS